jgi:hypothetical protein
MLASKQNADGLDGRSVGGGSVGGGRVWRWVLLCALLGVVASLTPTHAAAVMVMPDPNYVPPPSSEYVDPYYDQRLADELLRQHLPMWNTSAPIFHEFTDYALYSSTFGDDSDSEPDRLRLRVGVGQRLWKPIGPQTPDQAWTTTQLNAEVGFYHSNLAWIQARSFLDMGWLVSGDPQTPDQEGTVTQGSHRVRGQIGIGEVDDGLGVDLELDGRFDHMAANTLRSRPADILPLGHTDAGLRARLWLRSGDLGKDGSFVMPVTYDLRQVDYNNPQAGDLRGFTSETISTGIGMRPYSANADGWFEFVGLSWARHAFDADTTSGCTPCTLAGTATATSPQPLAEGALGALGGLGALGMPRLKQLEQIEVRTLHSDDITLYEDDFIVSGHFFLGGSWMWDPTGTHQAAMVTGAYGMSGRFEGGSAGFVVSRRPGFSPDATRAVGVWRIEWLAEMFLEEAHMGGAFRATSAWLQDLNRDYEQQSLPSQHTLYTELFFAPLTELQVGVFHNTGSTLAGDESWSLLPANTDYGWQHHLGAFARFNIEPLGGF